MPKVRVDCSSIFTGEETVVKGKFAQVDVDQAKRLVCMGHATLFANKKKEDGTVEEIECTFEEAAALLRMNSDDVARRVAYDKI